MKTSGRGLLVLFALLLTFPLQGIDRPTIRSIRLQGTNLLVHAEVPVGIKKVTLESRARFGSGTWIPRSVLRLGGSGGEASFTIPKSPQLELLRVRADSEDPLPSSFYTGTNTFYGQTGSTNTPGGVMIYGPGGDLAAGGDRATGESREVLETDIWKISGNTLYFFNQYRGLQIVDISDPDRAVIRGTLHLPFGGEDLYLLGPEHVVLLVQDNCSWGPTGPESKILIVDVTSGEPEVVQTLPVNGSIVESRMVGSALYVAAQTYHRTTNNSGGLTTETWEAGIQVSSFDLADPLNPRARSSLWFTGYSTEVSATDRFLFVAMRDPINYYLSQIRLIDISAPDGTMSSLSTIRPAGYIADKFKMNVNSNVFTTISASWSDTRRWTTTLETFSLTNPTTPVRLGRLTLAEGEQLHGTRFDGNLAYIVTYFRIDPLWVVDLSNAALPRIAGELQVPGWSTYLHPMGDRLVTVGIDDTNGFRVAVSLFNVSNPANPLLLSRVSLGENYSWSEANVDEKAFQVLPEHGLILVPYQGYWSNNYASRVQLIDLTRDTLAARGVIDHEMQPRRATVFTNRILSLSATELLSVDATDRDHPEVKGNLQLAWPVDRLLLSGNYLLEISAGSSWGNNQRPSVRVALKSDPETVLSTFTLSNNYPITGAEIRGQKVYLLQNGSDNYWYRLPTTNDVPETNLFLTVFDVSSLPALQVLGETSLAISNLGWNSNWELIFPTEETLVLSGGGNNWGPWLNGFGHPGPGPSMGRAAFVGDLFLPYWSSGGGRLIAFDVSNGAAPRFASDLTVSSNSWNFSKGFPADGKIYLSHAAYQEIILPAGGSGAPERSWSYMWFLNVVDYADPRDPMMRPPVNIPGRLEGLSHLGSVVYTVGPHWKYETNFVSDGSEFLDASAYDGVAAHLVDSLPLPTWPHPLVVNNDHLFLGKAGVTGTNGALEIWRLSSAGRFTIVGQTPTSSPISTLKLFGGLLAAQTYEELQLYNVSNLASPVLLKTDKPAACGWYWLDYAVGTLSDGIFIPNGYAGVHHVPSGQ